MGREGEGSTKHQMTSTSEDQQSIIDIEDLLGKSIDFENMSSFLTQDQALLEKIAALVEESKSDLSQRLTQIEAQVQSLCRALLNEDDINHKKRHRK